MGISPFSLNRGLGKFGFRLFKRLIPEMGYRFKQLVGDSNVVYGYLYHLNNQTPR
jgi:hypothetical protein